MEAMTEQEQRIAIAARHLGLRPIKGEKVSDLGHFTMFTADGNHLAFCPDYLNDRNAIHAALLHHGIQSHDNPAIRVRFIVFLREIASRRLPRNKSGASLMSDVDLVTCEAWELCEALLKTLKLYKP
jgi:hypothetical protein